MFVLDAPLLDRAWNQDSKEQGDGLATPCSSSRCAQLSRDALCSDCPRGAKLDRTILHCLAEVQATELLVLSIPSISIH
eukprot:3997901-Amphidinium_carterae.1